MIKLSFRNPYLIIVLAIIVVVISAVSINRLPVDILPQFKKSAMQILTLYPGMPAEVVEKDITSRMERWTGQSEGIERQTSKSMLGVSIVQNHFREDIDPATAMANTSSFAMSDMYYLPPGTLPPMVMPYDPTANIPLALLAVSSAAVKSCTTFLISICEICWAVFPASLLRQLMGEPCAVFIFMPSPTSWRPTAFPRRM